MMRFPLGIGDAAKRRALSQACGPSGASKRKWHASGDTCSCAIRPDQRSVGSVGQDLAAEPRVRSRAAENGDVQAFATDCLRTGNRRRGLGFD